MQVLIKLWDAFVFFVFLSLMVSRQCIQTSVWNPRLKNKASQYSEGGSYAFCLKGNLSQRVSSS